MSEMVYPADHPVDSPRPRSYGSQISDEIVRLFRKHGGRGPTRCKTYFDDDLVIVLLRETHTTVDQTLFEAGKWIQVREAKQAFQDAIEIQLTEVIERITGRTVLAFMCASHQHPDLMIEAFLVDAPIAFERHDPLPDMPKE